MIVLRDGRKVLYQWDLNAKAVVRNPDVKEVHWVHSNHPQDAWVVDVSKRGIVPIPNLCLQESGKLYGYESINGKRTETYSIFSIQPRPKPSDYIYTEVEIKRYEQLEKMLNELEDRVEDLEEDSLEFITNIEIDKLMLS